ncbi:MAG TPA: MFS transporter [Thermomicrobiales bacterium]|nr:MFS transporter [Thermomicrobiales bacterium]
MTDGGVAPTPRPPLPLLGEGETRLQSDALLLVTLCLASSLAVINALALAPFLAEIAPEIGTTVALLGQAVTATSLVGAAFALTMGPGADWAGYRMLLLAGIGAMIAGSLGTAIAPSYALLIGAQVIGGLSGAAITPMAFAIAGQRFTGEQRRTAIARMYAAAAGAGVVGFPLLTFIGERAGWRWSFVALGLAATLGLALAWVVIPRDRAERTAPFRLRTMLHSYRPILRHRSTALLYGGQFLRGVCWVGTLAYAGAFFVEELGRSLQEAGLIWVVVGPGFLIGSLLVSARLRLLDQRLTFAVSVALMGLTIGGVFVWQPSFLIAYALLFVAALFGGVAEVTTVTILAAESPAQQGTTMALNSAIIRLGSAGGGAIGGTLLATGGYASLGVGFPLVAFGAALCGWLSRRRSPTCARDAVRE